MIHSLVGPIPKHRYVWVEPRALGEHDEWLRGSWFGIQSHPSRAWGCHIMLDCGAVYRNVPLHHLSAGPSVNVTWTPRQAQVWDCYGYDFTVTEYPFLAEMGIVAMIRNADPKLSNYEVAGHFLFSVAPVGDGWSNAPEQSKEFFFVELENGRFAALPTNALLFDDQSFSSPQWPKFLRRQTKIWSAEE